MKNKKIPTLQFKLNESEWSWKRLSDISKKVTDKNKNHEFSETLTNSAELGIINQRDYFDKDISNKKNLNSYYIVKPDDFVYNPRISNFAPVGPIKRNKLGRTGVMSPLYYVFRTNDIDLAYLDSYFSSGKWHLFMKKNGDSGARSDRFSIKDTVFGEMPIPYPSKEIQKKIGDFFQYLDDTIALHQQELEALKQTKQGFLQKMFPKDGESVPEIRFKGFIGSWEMKSFQMVCENFEYGLNASAKEFDGKNQYIRITDIDDESRTFLKSNLTSPDCDLISAKNYLLKKGDLLFARTGASVGKTYLYHEDDGIVYYAGFLIRGTIKKNYNPEFIFQNTLTSSFNEFIKVTSQRSGQPGINAKEISTYSFLVPDYEEQAKIGEFFRQLDEVIELKEKELEALKETKKGFLQKMFV